jgi:hypothetical protein
MRRRFGIGRLLALALTALGLAATSAGAQAPAGGGDVGCHSQWPVVAHHAGGVLVSPGSTVPVACAADTGFETSESTLAVTNTGAIFYSPAHTENSDAVSSDGGGSWGLSYPPDEQYTSLWNTDDPFLTVDRRTGRVFWSHATGDLRTTPILVSNSPLPNGVPTALAYAHGFQVYSTPDDGRTWRTASYSEEPTGDWDKLAVGPPPPGGAKPSGYPDVVYMCANAPFEVSGPGSDCYKSLDGGATFSLAGYVFPSAAEPPDVCLALNANTPVVGNDGTIYHPINCQQADYVAISRDEGATYSWVTVPGAPPASGIGGSLQLAIDQADNLYALWQSNDRLYLSVSRDHARTWGSPMMVTAPGLHSMTLPAFAAGARGQVGIAYYASTDPTAKKLTAYITQTADALTAQPLFYTGALNPPAQPIFEDYGFNASPRADYVGGGYDSHGTFWAGVVRQFGVPDANGNIATTGHVGHLVSGPGGSAAGAAALAALPAGACLASSRLAFRINRVPGGRVVRVTVSINGRRVLARRGRDLRRVSLARPNGRRLRVRIVTVNNRGGRVTTVRTFVGCARTKVRGKVKRHRRTSGSARR